MIRSIFLLFVLAGMVTACNFHQPVENTRVSALDAYYSKWQHTSYRMGGESARGLDCSAFVQNAYRDVYQLRLPRSTREQAKIGNRVAKRRLARGDLVFFKTGWRQRHVGIYMGNNQFIHASRSKGVMESSLNDPYWKKRYWKARRPH